MFYVGHIPAFRDIHLARYFNEPLTEPAHFADIFERGIDPCVDDPNTITHWHSEVPKEEACWPTLQEITAYEASVRDRVRKVYAEHEGRWTTKLARVLMMTFEHEMWAFLFHRTLLTFCELIRVSVRRMHWETSVYICLQAAGSLNLPPGTAIPDFVSLARQAKRDFGQNGGGQRLSFESHQVTVGHDDGDTVDDQTPFDPAREYGWDVEHPRRQLQIDAFEIDALPISNGEYQQWLVRTGQTSNKALTPSSWTDETGEVSVKTLFGLVPLALAEEWPVAASAEQLEQFAKVSASAWAEEAICEAADRVPSRDSPRAADCRLSASCPRSTSRTPSPRLWPTSGSQTCTLSRRRCPAKRVTEPNSRLPTGGCGSGRLRSSNPGPATVDPFSTPDIPAT